MGYIKINGKALKETLESTNISIAVMSVGALGHARGYIYEAMRRGTMLEGELKNLRRYTALTLKTLLYPKKKKNQKKK